MRVHPIPPASEPMQYRAIGLIEGQYQPTDAELTQGTLVSSTGSEIDAVLLGRVISLVKNHLDLSSNHLWVVYPRTKKEDDNLHVQIVGVWEPEKLDHNLADSTELADLPDLPEVKSGYFSIRGGVVFHAFEAEKVVVKINQSPRRKTDKPKSFKLNLRGQLPTKGVGHFWDLQVQLQEQDLVIQSATDIGEIPSFWEDKKGKKAYGKPSGGGSPGSRRPVLKGEKRKTKPVIRKNQNPSED